ncbi:MAG: TonB-dependent receptor [Alphaproteobacteria bacterium]|nr:TonB-dependent receptor [Alphaproteobacteria bacterium]MBU1517110.1 TonB-dependent receptor [Alphaproteobacteria bacterium]MBU2093729.1 TonB-dependent receptor [Alphaproteobacteria bacterium]MBU2153949.1 TonB-dependent receptor [Alphaproteobacteria bacterium]MBU2308671.1 TonB-dependent receptor [Alphaproteobacteria bacterium]
MKTPASLRALLAASASVTVFAFTSPAFAADASTEVGEVLVTAQKKSENINDVPLAVTAISGQKLDAIRSSGGDIRVFSARVPSLTLESSFGRTFPRPYIRGLGNTDFDLNASQPVSFVYDEVVLETPVLKGFPLFDIDQVEVLKGPQGTLFGRNTPAGVLKFDSAKPTQTFGGYAQASYATYSTINAEGAVSGPILPGVLAGRLSGLYQHRDDWVDNTLTPKKNDSEGYDQFAIRGQLLFTPTEDLSALLNLHYQHLDGTPRVFRANIIQKGTNNFVPGFKRDEISQDAQSRAVQKVESAGASLKLNYDFGEGMPTLTSITAYERVDTYSRADIDGGFGAVFAPPSGPGLIPFPSESADGIPFHRQFTQEVRLAGQNGPVGYTIGAFYFNESIKIDSYDYNTLAGGALQGFAYQNQKSESWAVFANADYQVSDQLKVGGGLRYSNDKKDFLAQRTLSPFGAPPTAILRANPDTSEVSFNANATYAVSDDLNVYGRVSRGYRAPSIQGRLVFGDTLSVAKKETVMSYEAGIKGKLPDARARFDASVFYYRANDLQITAVGGGANFNRLLNADKATGYGFEFNAEAEPVDRLLLTAGFSYNHTELQDAGLATAPCGSGCTVLDPAGTLPGTVSIDGNSLPNAPKWIANFTAGYSWPVGAGEIFVFTDWAYRSKVNFFLYESAEYNDDKLIEGGLRLGYRAPDAKWEVAAFGRNITNDKSLEGGIDFNNLTGFVNDPRVIGVEVKTTF